MLPRLKSMMIVDPSRKRPISSAGSSRSRTARKGGHGDPYEERTKDELRERAREVGIEGRSTMSKAELVEALRNH